MERTSVLLVVGTVVLSTACGLAVVGDAADGGTASDAGSAQQSDGNPTTSSSGGDGDGSVPPDLMDGSGKDGASSGDASKCIGALCKRVVFITSTTYTGNLGGIVGADAKCNARAAVSTQPLIIGRKFVAWLATSASSPATRFDRRGSFVRPDGVAIATSWNDLTDNSIAAKIQVDELGAVNNGTNPNDNVWTGVKDDGTAAGSITCSGWGSSVGLGHIGLLTNTDKDWTDARNDEGCNNLNYLYCFEE